MHFYGRGVALIASAAILVAAAIPAYRWIEKFPTAGRFVEGSEWSGPRAKRQAFVAQAETINVIGQVIDQGDATTGTITIRAGSNVAQTVGTVSPQFMAAVPAAQDGDMVVVEVQGQGFKFVSILGTYGKLARQAGADRILTLDESDALRVSPISTALQFFIARRLGGMPASDVAIERAMRSLLSQDLGAAAVALARMARGALPHPQGYANGYELLQDQSAYASYLQQHSEVLYEFGDELATMPSAGFTGGDPVQSVALLGPVADLEAPMVPPAAQVMERTAGGYKVHSDASRRDAVFTGGLDANNDLHLVPTNGIVFDTYRGLCSASGPQILERRTLLSETYRQHRKGDGVSLWLVVSEYERSFPNCPDYPSSTYKTAFFWSALDLRRVHPVSDMPRFFGLRTLPDFCIAEANVPGIPRYLRTCGYEIHRFDAPRRGVMLNVGDKVDETMSPITARGQVPFTWNIPEQGVMRISDGEVSTRYWTVDGGNAAVRGLVYVAEGADNGETLSLAGYVAMIDGNPSSGFESLSPVGTWRYATFEQALVDPYTYTGFTYTFRFLRRADGTAVRTQARGSVPGPGFETLSRWSLLDGRLYDVRVDSDTGMPAYDCADAFAGGATQCGPSIVRSFHPLKRVGSRLYGVEDIYSNLSILEENNYSPPFRLFRSSRPTYYELE